MEVRTRSCLGVSGRKGSDEDEGEEEQGDQEGSLEVGAGQSVVDRFHVHLDVVVSEGPRLQGGLTKAYRVYRHTKA